MGNSGSNIKELNTNELLKRFASSESIPQDDIFWYQLLDFSLSTADSSTAKSIEDVTAMILKNLAVHNPETGNFITLIDIFVSQIQVLHKIVSAGIQENNESLRQACNALLIIQFSIKHFNELLSEELMLLQFTATKKDSHDSNVLRTDELMNYLIEILVDITVTDSTYSLHLLAVNTLIVLLSCKMFRSVPAENLSFYVYLIKGKCSVHACLLMKKLLENFIRQHPTPASVAKCDSGGSLLYDATSALASGLLTVVTLGYAGGRSSGDANTPILLADQSLLLLLVLANHCVGNREMKNPFRESLFSCTNKQVDEEKSKSQSTSRSAVAPGNKKSPSPSAKSLTATGATFRIDMSALYTVLCTRLDQEAPLLLLYLLMHRNSAFRISLMQRKDNDKAVVPILKILYKASHENSHQLYMALIVLLMFTEDEKFTETANHVMIKGVHWTTERQFSEISLGSLMVMILIRTIQQNLHQLRDKYLHTNCLAALANMSSRFTNLHPYVSQRLVGLIHHLSKRHGKTLDKISLAAESVKSGSKLSTGLGCSEEEFVQELSVLEEVTRMVLEILNSALSHRLAVNHHLIYSLLHQRDEFDVFRTHPAFQDILQNIDSILSFFIVRIDKECGQEPSEHCVMTVIQNSANLLTKNQALKKFPELKFKYVEEDSPDEFFIPYVWSLVCRKSLLYFNPSRIVLFQQQGAIA